MWLFSKSCVILISYSEQFLTANHVLNPQVAVTLSLPLIASFVLLCKEKVIHCVSHSVAGLWSAWVNFPCLLKDSGSFYTIAPYRPGSTNRSLLHHGHCCWPKNIKDLMPANISHEIKKCNCVAENELWREGHGPALAAALYSVVQCGTVRRGAVCCECAVS